MSNFFDDRYYFNYIISFDYTLEKLKIIPTTSRGWLGTTAKIDLSINAAYEGLKSLGET